MREPSKATAQQTPATLDPSNFRANLSDNDLLELATEIEADRKRTVRLELTVTPEQDPNLSTCEVIWLEIRSLEVSARYMVVSAQRSFLDTKYVFIEHEPQRRLPCDKVLTFT